MTAVAISGAGTTNVIRTGKVGMEHRKARLLELAEEAAPASVRHLYYRAVVAGLVEKKQTGYRKVQRAVLELRRSGRMPYDWIVDHGRSAHWPTVEDSPAGALRYLALTYVQDPWIAGSPRVEIWCESESIAGVLMPLRESHTVPIFPCVGQASETFAYEAARTYRATEPVVILYAGDYDPAGLQIGAQLEGKLRHHGGDGLQLDFRRLSITDEQAAGNLQILGTPPKQQHWIDYAGNRHEFVGQAIEAEAVPATDMRSLFAREIERVALEAHPGRDIFAEARHATRMERGRLYELAGRWSS